jgi:hypothetical protein
MDKITIMHNGNRFTVSKSDVSEKVWQELKDNRPLTTEEHFKPKDGGSSYATFEDKESKEVLDFLYPFICILLFSAIMFCWIALIYKALQL